MCVGVWGRGGIGGNGEGFGLDLPAGGAVVANGERGCVLNPICS